MGQCSTAEILRPDSQSTPIRLELFTGSAAVSCDSVIHLIAITRHETVDCSEHRAKYVH